MIEYIAPMDTSELASGDNITRQKARATFNKFKQALAKKDKCWNCFNLSHCTGFIHVKVCDVIKNDERLMALYKDYKEKEKQARKTSRCRWDKELKKVVKIEQN
ncbi:MAG: hypothetical protein UIG52_06675 [Bacteroidales bacterium]|nr:hypothetical protein [Bacteroidales bacterium]